MSGTLNQVHVRTASGAYDIEADAVRIGDDLLVWIRGGELPHIGAVAAAQPRPSLKDPEKTSATASVITYLGHKEDELAKRAAEALASALETRVVVTAGIHWDHLDQEGIRQVVENSRELITLVIERLKE